MKHLPDGDRHELQLWLFPNKHLIQTQNFFFLLRMKELSVFFSPSCPP